MGTDHIWTEEDLGRSSNWFGGLCRPTSTPEGLLRSTHWVSGSSNVAGKADEPSVGPQGWHGAVSSDRALQSVVDFHAHYVPRSWLAEVATGRFGGTISKEGDILVTSDGWIKVPKELTDLEMATAGVSLRAFSLPPFGLMYEAPAETAAKACRSFNEALLAETESCRQARALATLPMQDSQKAETELQWAMEAGCVGAQIGSNVNGQNLDAGELRGFFKLAAELGAVLLIHPYRVLGRQRLSCYYLANLLGNPVETAVAAAALIFGGVLEEAANLRVVLAHGGGATPWLLGRWDRGYVTRPEFCATIPFKPSVYARRMFYDTVVHSPANLRFLIERVGVSQVVIGTDYPYPMGDSDFREHLTQAGVLPADQERILTLNAGVILGRDARTERGRGGA